MNAASPLLIRQLSALSNRLVVFGQEYFNGQSTSRGVVLTSDVNGHDVNGNRQVMMGGCRFNQLKTTAIRNDNDNLNDNNHNIITGNTTIRITENPLPDNGPITC